MDYIFTGYVHPVLLFRIIASKKELCAPPARPSLFFPIISLFSHFKKIFCKKK